MEEKKEMSLNVKLMQMLVMTVVILLLPADKLFAGNTICTAASFEALQALAPNLDQCTTDEEGRAMIEIGADFDLGNNNLIKMSRPEGVYLVGKDRTIKMGSGSYIELVSGKNFIESLKIEKTGGEQFAIKVKTPGNRLINSTISSSVNTCCNNTLILEDAAKAELKSGSELTDVFYDLICKNTITTKKTGGKATNIDLDSDGKDDYVEYHGIGSLGYAFSACAMLDKQKKLAETAQSAAEVGAAFTEIMEKCGYGTPDDKGVCTCFEGYSKDNSGRCFVCMDDYTKDPSGGCVPCANVPGMTIKDGKCVTCANGECATPTCGANETLTESGECVCQDGSASYNGMKDAPCVECGPNSTGIDGGECKCDNSFHVSLNGSCISDNFDCSEDDPHATLEDKKCVCKTQFAYKVDPNGKPYCEMIPCTIDGEKYYEAKGECLSPDAVTCIEKGDEWKAGQCKAAEAAGDCKCNFTGGETTVAQALIPFVAILFGTGGLVVWRKRKGL